MFPSDEIVDATVLSIKMDGESSLDGSWLVRIYKKTPAIEIVCADRQEAEETAEWVLKSKKVVDLKDYRKE